MTGGPGINDRVHNCFKLFGFLFQLLKDRLITLPGVNCGFFLFGVEGDTAEGG